MREKLLIYTLILFCLSPILSYQETATPSFAYFSMFLVVVLPQLLWRGSIVLRNYHLYAVGYALVLFFSWMLNGGGYYPLVELLKVVLYVVFFISLTGLLEGLEKDSLSTLEIYIRYVSVILAILILASYIFGYPHLSSDYYLGRYSIGITGLYKNPNYLMSFVILGYVSFMVELFSNSVNTYKKLALILGILLLLVASYLSGTRASLGIKVVIFLAFLLRFFRKNPFRFVVVGLIILVLGSLLKDWLTAKMFSFLATRSFMDDSMRFETWKHLLSSMEGSYIFGLGPHSDDLALLNAKVFVDDYIHNIFLEILYNSGLIGLVMIVGTIFSDTSRSLFTNVFLSLVLLICLFVPLSFQNGLVGVNFWRAVILWRCYIFTRNIVCSRQSFDERIFTS